MTAHTLKTVLIIRLSSIGDVILTSPFLRVLKQQNPSCRVHFAVRREFSDLLLHNPNIDRIINVDAAQSRGVLRSLNLLLMNERYDAVFDLHNNFRSRTLRNGLARNIHVIDKRVIHRSLLVWAHANYYGEVSPVPERYIETARKYDVRSDALGPELFLSDDVRGSARLKLRSTGWDFDAETIGICPGARHYTKRWPEEHVEALAGLLLERGYHLAVFGAETDSRIGDRLHRLYPARVHNCCGRLSLLETAAAMQHCHTLFTNDSGLMHMATAMEKPVVAIFGSTVREFGFFPYHQRSVVVEVEGLRCRPCTHIGRNDCPKGHLACLREISPEDVLAAFDSLRDPIPKQT